MGTALQTTQGRGSILQYKMKGNTSASAAEDRQHPDNGDVHGFEKDSSGQHFVKPNPKINGLSPASGAKNSLGLASGVVHLGEYDRYLKIEPPAHNFTRPYADDAHDSKAYKEHFEIFKKKRVRLAAAIEEGPEDFFPFLDLDMRAEGSFGCHDF